MVPSAANFVPPRRMRPALSAALLIVAGLLAVVDAAAGNERKVVSENEGSVCFWRGHTGDGAVAMFRPALGCQSSSCTIPVEQSFTTTVRGGDRPEIAMTSRFVITFMSGDVMCTADCGGGGSATSVLTRLEPGVYNLTLGGKMIGELDTGRLEGDPFNRICFGTGE